jgi:PhnB protein
MTIEGTNARVGWCVAPHIVVRDVAAAIQFYQRAFDAEVVLSDTTSAGSIQSARLRIGNSSFIVAGESHPSDVLRTKSPSSLGGTSVSLELFVDDFDAAFERASLAGAEPSTVAGPCVGDRVSALRDPFGHIWIISTFIEDGGALCV